MKIKSLTLRCLMATSLIVTCLLTASCSFMQSSPETTEKGTLVMDKFLSLTSSQQLEVLERLNAHNTELMNDPSFQQKLMDMFNDMTNDKHLQLAMKQGDDAAAQNIAIAYFNKFMNQLIDQLLTDLNDYIDAMLGNQTKPPVAAPPLPGGTIIIAAAQSEPPTTSDPNQTNPLQDPSKSPQPQLITILTNNVSTITPISPSSTNDSPNNPRSQLLLATNSVGNEISISGMMNESVMNTITGPMQGTYTGDLSGTLSTGSTIFGTMSLTMDLTGPGSFNGHVDFTDGGVGRIGLSFYNAGNGSGSFNSTGITSNTATIYDSSGHTNVNGMNLNGMFKGSNANGTWNMDLVNSTTGKGNFNTTHTP